MIHSISSDLLEVSVKQTGIELCSIKNRQTGTEYIWQGNPDFWSGQAPVLFPIIGALKDQSTIIEGKEYRIPKHGIVRHSTKPVITHHSSHSITFQLHWDEETLAFYPFHFVFEVTFTLKEKQLSISHTLRNLGDKELPYNVGGHPAFNCPINSDEEYSDYFIEFQYPEHSESWLIDNYGLLTDSHVPMLENSAALRLHSRLFDRDALIFKNLQSNYATLKSDLSGDILRVDFHEFPFLGIWAKPGAPFVCIEPWHGITDHQNTDRNFLKKQKLRVLAPNAEETLSYQITILD